MIETPAKSDPVSSALGRFSGYVSTAILPEMPLRISGRITSIQPASLTIAGLSCFAELGDRVWIETAPTQTIGEIVRLNRAETVVKTFNTTAQLSIGMRCWLAGSSKITPAPAWKGRILNALALPVDGLGFLPQGQVKVTPEGNAPPAMTRERVSRPLQTGVMAIDLFTPICAGQRIGIFAGSGVGKTTLLSMLARCAGFDTVVVGLVGERGREVREFVEECLGDNLKKAVIIVATGDESPMMRRLAPKTATCIAEYFRDRGESVLLILDSVTRFAHAARDVALAAGEPPVTRGYTPSVFSELPRLLERAGPGILQPDGTGGSITGIFSVLVDGDDHNDPVADNIRGTLDGHIVLDRHIAEQGRFPAINLLRSISRLSQHVWSADQQKLIRRLVAMIARFEDTRDLRLMGGYQAGNDPELDQAVQLVPRLYEALVQSPTSPLSEDAFREMANALHISDSEGGSR